MWLFALDAAHMRVVANMQLKTYRFLLRFNTVPFAFVEQAVSECETACFAFQNGLF